jgi:surfeit locus 1 family protein
MIGRLSTIAFAVLMLALTGVFAALGLWQLERLREKETLIAAVEERTTQPPRPLPPVAEWVGFDSEVFDYRPVTVTGTYVPAETIRVFTSLSEAKGEASGPGYWVITPLAVTGGGYVLINRGFVPQRLGDNYAASGDAPVGEVTVAGVARTSEEVSTFTPGTDRANRIEWVRNVPRLAALLGPAITPLAPITIDAPAGPSGALPQGGETTMSFPNNHLGYAITWFGFAILTPILLVIWLFRQRLSSRKP